MPYYHDLVTQRSWEALQALRKQLDFLLIGGWAVYLYTKALKSKDIDVIVDFPDCLALLKAGIAELKEAASLLKRHGRADALETFRLLLGEHREVPELSLNVHHLARLKKRLLAPRLLES